MVTAVGHAGSKSARAGTSIGVLTSVRDPEDLEAAVPLPPRRSSRDATWVSTGIP